MPASSPSAGRPSPFALGLVAGLKDTRLLDALIWRNLPIIGLTGTLLAAHGVIFSIAVKVSGVAVATLGFPRDRFKLQPACLSIDRPGHATHHLQNAL